MSIEGQGHFLPYIFQVLYVLCFIWTRYQVSVYRTIGPLVYSIIFILAGKLVSHWDVTNSRLVGDNGLRY